MPLSNLLFSNIYVLNIKLKKQLCETLFNFYDSLCYQCLLRSDVLKIQIERGWLSVADRKRKLQRSQRNKILH